MQRRHFLYLSSLAALGSVSGTGLTAMGRKPAGGISATPGAEDVMTSIPDMVMGTQDAAFEILEYASFTCPHCANFHSSVMPRLVKDQIETGQARFIFREVYFDRPGIWASLMARAAGPERYFAIADLLYERQREWTTGDPAAIAQNLRKLGKIAGMSDDVVEAAFADKAKAEALVAWQEAHLARDDVNSTPTIFVNGTRTAGWGYDQITSVM